MAFFPEPTFTDSIGLFSYLNTITGDWQPPALLLFTFIFVFIGLQAFGNDQAFTTSGFLTTVAAALMAGLQWIQPEIVLIPFIITVAGFGFMFLTGR